MSPLIIIVIVLVVLVVFVVAIYNGLIKSKVRVDEAWSDINIQLKRRYDLIPNLVNTVKGYATHEAGVFEQVTAARTSAMNAGTIADKAAAENQLAGTLKSLFAVAEGLSGPQGQPGLPAVASRAGGHRRQDPSLTPLLQWQRA